MREFISLGHNCGVAAVFRRYWSCTQLYNSGLSNLLSQELSKLCQGLESEYENFFSLDNLKIIPYKSYRPHHIVLDERYFVESLHEFPIDRSIEEGLDRFEAKVNIKEFIHRLKHSNEPIFVRTNLKKEPLDQTIILYEIIRKLRSEKPFDLVVFQDKEFMKHNWGISHLHTYYCRNWKFITWNEWEGDDELWVRVLSQFQKPFLML